MAAVQETIMLFDLEQNEADLVNRLISSFAIETVNLSLPTIRAYLAANPNHSTALVIYRAQADNRRNGRIIRLLRDFVGPLVPFLVLVPQELLDQVRKYLDSGADDFMEMPINPDRFSLAFLILLEMGQALLRPNPQMSPRTERRSAFWQRVVAYLQQGITYFAPKSLIIPRRPEEISERWQQVKRLGLGGFGVVWQVREQGSGRLAVAKIPHSSQMNIRVLRSAAILKRLSYHPHIVQHYEIVKDSGKLILIQEFIEGVTLQQLLAGSMAAKLKETIFAQLLSVVAFAHRHKILHRDIKPENIMVNKQGQAKLLDFGIARDLSWQSGESRAEGTVNYMAPEQLAGKSCLASDVWSLGVILYLFATGSSPYQQQNDGYPSDLETTMDSRPPRNLNPNLDPALEEIILTCLRIDPRQRYADAASLEEELIHRLPGFGGGTYLPASNQTSERLERDTQQAPLLLLPEPSPK